MVPQARRVGIFGWGVVAPRSPNISAFEKNLDRAGSWLKPFDGFGPSNFLVGEPDFRFEDYKPWIDARFAPTRFAQLQKKAGMLVKYALGAFIQSLAQNPGIDRELTALGEEARVYVGTGLGDLPTAYEATLGYARALRRWNRFWAEPERNAALREWLAAPQSDAGAPPRPEDVPVDERDEAEERFWAHWTARSRELQQYLRELREIEGLSVEGDVESAKLAAIKERRTRTGKLQKKWSAPDAPWNCVDANVLWNIHNAPAAQVSMLGNITGMCFAPVAACASFGYGLRLAMDAIRAGDAKAVVLGMTDPPPHPLTVGAFYQARVLAADGETSRPLTGLRGTHVAGGSALWIVGDYDYFTAKGFRPLGAEPVAVGVGADADHIITPSREGPVRAMRQALARAGARPDQVVTLDLHATATPGDFNEVQTVRDVLGQQVLLSARKGAFGHGMGVCGGWELTAQFLGLARGTLHPTSLKRADLNTEISRVHEEFVFDTPIASPPGLAAKLSMGIGGINSCVLARPLDAKK